MLKLKQKLKNLLVKMYVNTIDSSLKQGENIAPVGGKPIAPDMPALLCRAAAEGAVLLKNDGTLPLKGKTALYGRVQIDTFYTGYGSGGNVLKPYRVSILEGLEKNKNISLDEDLVKIYREWTEANPVDHGFWGNWPRAFPEMPLEESLVAESAYHADVAVVVIGRAAGEERENELSEGSYYLTADERNMLELVTKHYQKTVVVLNIGNIIDFSWIEEYPINAALLVWQGGMETGNAVAKLLSGEVSPCGKLCSTVAKKYEDYPSSAHFGDAFRNEYFEDIFVGYRWFETFAKDNVLYPFGHGLSYTTFDTTASFEDGKVKYCVKNTGERAGKEVVQIYVKKPDGDIGNPARELVGIRKTMLLLPGGEETGELVLDERRFCSYDEEKSSYVMLAGDYELFIGGSARDAVKFAEFTIQEEKIVEQLSEQCAPRASFEILAYNNTRKFARLAKKNLKKEILKALPPEIPYTGYQDIKLKDVKNGKATMENFVAQLTPEELEALSRGDYVMNSPLGADGNAGVFGGVLPELQKKGIPPVTATDGPSGIRLKTSCSLIPIGTLLACTFDEELVFEVYAAVGREMKERETDILLAPAMNLHRNPLCGRNFEYFSEDPFLTGKIAAAAVRGVQREGLSACPKHFACNNQEFNRNKNDSVLTERALRELYLTGFEICVKEGKPKNIMTSYNKVNGVWSHYHYELVRGILRGEWGYDGNVMTDWWMQSATSPEFPKCKRNAYRVRAGVNVLMPGGGHFGRKKPDGTLLKNLGQEGGITLGELQRNAMEILNFVMNSPAMERFEKQQREKARK